jgi:hypothetical protein
MWEIPKVDSKVDEPVDSMEKQLGCMKVGEKEHQSE